MFQNSEKQATVEDVGDMQNSTFDLLNGLISLVTNSTAMPEIMTEAMDVRFPVIYCVANFLK